MGIGKEIQKEIDQVNRKHEGPKIVTINGVTYDLSADYEIEWASRHSIALTCQKCGHRTIFHEVDKEVR